MPDGTQITMRGCSDNRRGCTLVMKYLSIFSQISKSAMTPSFSGRIAWMCAGVRPIIRLASVPTASKRPSRALTATTDGSSSTIPRTADVHDRVGSSQVDSHVATHELREHSF